MLAKKLFDLERHVLFNSVYFCILLIEPSHDVGSEKMHWDFDLFFCPSFLELTDFERVISGCFCGLGDIFLSGVY